MKDRNTPEATSWKFPRIINLHNELKGVKTSSEVPAAYIFQKLCPSISVVWRLSSLLTYSRYKCVLQVLRYPRLFMFSGSDIVLQAGSLVVAFRRNFFFQSSGLKVEEMRALKALVPSVSR